VLPQLRGDLFLTDGGIETTLIFHRGLDLPEFAAFPLLEDAEGLEVLRAYYEPYLRLAGEHGSGFVLESPTWRASPRWGQALGYDEARLDELNRRAIGLMEVLRAEHAPAGGDIVISGCIGPHDDGYDPALTLSAQEAQAYHATQIGTFADAGADLVTAMTITYAEEAIGMTRAAGDSGLPAAISFTVETDGRLPSGQTLGDAIVQVDRGADPPPAYYMVNCAHPTHFEGVLDPGAPWLHRIRGLRANASTKSHAELDEAADLDAGDPAAARYAGLRDRLPALTVSAAAAGPTTGTSPRSHTPGARESDAERPHA
jgi:S-methylmethionine-dependent homocysteine/selenocysteine methylase